MRHALRSLHVSVQYLAFLPDATAYVTVLLSALGDFVELYLIKGYPVTHTEVPAASTPDGYECLIDCFCAALPLCAPAPRLQATSPIEIALLQLCYHCFDQLAALPSLFSDMIRYYTCLASCHPDNALCIYQLMHQMDSPLLSQQMLVALPLTLQDTLAKQQGALAQEDEKGFIELFRLLAALVRHPSIRRAILHHPSVNMISVTMNLASTPLSVAMHAVLCEFLTSCCEGDRTARVVWAQFEQGCVIHQPATRGALCSSLHVHTGLQRALDVEEAPLRHYPLTLAFLRLLDTLIQRLPLDVTLTSNVLYAFLSFTVHDVLLKCEHFVAEDEEEKACLLFYSLSIVTRSIQSLYAGIATLTPEVVHSSCILSLVAELLSGSPLTEKVLAVHATVSSPYPLRPLPQHSLCPRPRDASWTSKALDQAMQVVLVLLQFSSSVIASLQIQRTLSGGQHLVTPLSQQLLAHPQPTIHLLLHLVDASQPALQATALQILCQLAVQNPPAAFFSFFASFPSELAVIRKAFAQILKSAIASSSMSDALPSSTSDSLASTTTNGALASSTSDSLASSTTNGALAPSTSNALAPTSPTKCAEVLLDLLDCQRSGSNASVISFLMDLDAVLQDGGVQEDSLLEGLLQLLSSPYQIQRHLPIAAACVRVVCGCCSCPFSSTTRFYECLIQHRVLGELASTIPFFLSHYATHAQSAEEQEALLEFVYYAVRTFSVVLFTLHKDPANTRFVSTVLLSLFEYDERVVACFQNTPLHDHTPLMDALDRMRWFGEEKQALSDALLALEVKREKRTVWGASYACLDKRCVEAVLHPFCASRHIANEEALRASLLKECDLVAEMAESDL